ncbi:hypothetical protein Hanom_Chr15g01355941 [Helianthus anomalus]
MDDGQVSHRAMVRVWGAHASFIGSWSFTSSKGKKIQVFCIWASHATRMGVSMHLYAGRLMFRNQARILGGSRPAFT